jgi:glutamate 5-kinase
MRPFFVGLFFVVFHCFFRIDACTLGNNGGNVVLMSNDTFYDGTVGDNTTLFFMTNFTQGPDLFLAVDLIGYLTSNETQNPTVVQMNIVDDDNHAIGIMTTGKSDE